MERKIVHTYTYNSKDFPGEKNSDPSLTVPDMAMSPAEIMRRFAQGRGVPQSPNLVFTGDEYLPDMRTMDLVDIENLTAENQHKIKMLSAQLQEEEKRKKLRVDNKESQLEYQKNTEREARKKEKDNTTEVEVLE